MIGPRSTYETWSLKSLNKRSNQEFGCAGRSSLQYIQTAVYGLLQQQPCKMWLQPFQRQIKTLDVIY
jgi:hypothetical protein